MRDAFISYNSQDRAAVVEIVRRLTASGLTVFFDRDALLAGQPWQPALEHAISDCRAVVVFLGSTGLGRWQLREQYLALDLQASRAIPSVIPVLLPGGDPPLGFLRLNTWIDLRNGITDEGVATLRQGINGGQTSLITPEGPVLRAISPYRGLRYFREEDAPLFFGRELFVNRLLPLVLRRSLVAVVGGSGSGKSSVVRAGLLPALRREPNAVWDIATMIPSDRPFHNLAAALGPLVEESINEIEQLRATGVLAAALSSGEITLRDVVERAVQRQPGTDRLLLFVDQWEELYTLTADTVARRFTDALLDATAMAPLTVVLTVRGDFYGKILDDGPLLERLRDATEPITTFSRGELHDLIEKPAQATGLSLEPGLTDVLLNEMQPDRLPLLEFVLTELWKRRSGSVMTHEAYRSIGGIQGAIAAHADRAFDALPAPDRDVAQRVLLQLVRLPAEEPDAVQSDDASEDRAAEVLRLATRRRCTLEELGSHNQGVINRLANALLVVTGRDAAGREVVDLVHEALIQQWETLRTWILDAHEFLRWREGIRTFRQVTGGAKSQVLLRGRMLAVARRWRASHKTVLSPGEVAFIDASSRAAVTWWAVAAATVAIGLLAVSFVPGVRERVWTRGTVVNPALPNGPKASELPSADPLNLPARGIEASKTVPIPVVVHVIARTDEDNITDDQVRSQIEALNRDYRARNTEEHEEVPAPFQGAIGDPNIEFSLAERRWNNGTPGIIRVRTNQPVDVAGGKISPAWEPEQYLNIWVTKLPGGVLGQSSSPGEVGNLDGVSIDPKVFGTTGTVVRPFNLGRTAVHDVGHYLGLVHPWGARDGRKDCLGTDFVDDTPVQEGLRSGTPSFPSISCNNAPHGDMFMNYMNYTDDEARYMFTKGQVERMRRVLAGPRSRLPRFGLTVSSPPPSGGAPAARTAEEIAILHQKLPGLRESSRAVPSTQPAYVIGIDPGHGGWANIGGSSPNNATSETGILEKDLTLELALLIENEVLAAEKTAQQRVGVVLTRRQDVNLSLADRANAVSGANTVVFVSLHFNGFSDSSVRGTGALVRPKSTNANDGTDVRLANALAEAVSGVFARHGLRTANRGVREQDAGVLRGISVPACVLDVEFITNPDVDRLLISGPSAFETRKELAATMARTLLSFARKQISK
jgi:N-acetylmuramoyl-L-alanine amidase